jgi:hypothetical protein
MFPYMTLHGTTHHFSSHEIDATWYAVPGVYMFVRLAANGNYDIFYAGQCERFCDRIPYHDMKAASIALGATMVHAVVVHNSYERNALEADIIGRYNPPLNTQLRTAGIRPNLLDLLGDIPRPIPTANPVDSFRRPVPSTLGTLPQFEELRRPSMR